MFVGALLCSTSPLAETRLTVYRRSQHAKVTAPKRDKLNSMFKFDQNYIFDQSIDVDSYVEHKKMLQIA